jgi:very-short-patch-repair endonuclease
LVQDGVLVRIRRGVVVGSCTLQAAKDDRRALHRLRLSALLLAYEGCVASHESAAILHDLPVLDLPPHVIVTRARGAWRGGPNDRIRVAPLPTAHLTAIDGLPVTAIARTVVDVARTGSLRATFVTGDAAIRRCGRTGIDQALDESRAWADLGRVGRDIARLDGRSESALESVSRAVFAEHELPLPELQVELTAPARRYRVDFLWRVQRVIGEADGLGKYDAAGALRAEKLRQEDLESLGFRVIRWTWRDMLVDTEPTIARLRRALGG